MSITDWHRKDDLVKSRFTEIKDLEDIEITITFKISPNKNSFNLNDLMDNIVSIVYNKYNNRLATSRALGVGYRNILNILKRVNVANFSYNIRSKIL